MAGTKHDAPDPGGYWPDVLAPDGARLGVNPAEADFVDRDPTPLPWLWWGLRFPDPGDSPPEAMGCGLVRDIHHLEPHIEPWMLVSIVVPELRNE